MEKRDFFSGKTYRELHQRAGNPKILKPVDFGFMGDILKKAPKPEHVPGRKSSEEKAEWKQANKNLIKSRVQNKEYSSVYNAQKAKVDKQFNKYMADLKSGKIKFNNITNLKGEYYGDKDKITSPINAVALNFLDDNQKNEYKKELDRQFDVVKDRYDKNNWKFDISKQDMYDSFLGGNSTFALKTEFPELEELKLGYIREGNIPVDMSKEQVKEKKNNDTEFDYPVSRGIGSTGVDPTPI